MSESPPDVEVLSSTSSDDGEVGKKLARSSSSNTPSDIVEPKELYLGLSGWIELDPYLPIVRAGRVSYADLPFESSSSTSSSSSKAVVTPAKADLEKSNKRSVKHKKTSARSSSSSVGKSNISSTRGKKSFYPEQEYYIKAVGEHDVLFGRGSAVSTFPGNISYRKLILKHREEYAAAGEDRKAKSEIISKVVETVKNKGYFLEKHPKKELYREVELSRVNDKTCQALRERKWGGL